MITAAMEEGFALIVVDSVASLIPESKQDKVDKDATARSIGSESTMWKENGSRIVSGLYDSTVLKVDGTECPEVKPSIIFINQQRANVSSPFGGKKTPGGHWLLHHYTIRIRLQLAKKAADEETGGRRVMYSLDKNKVAPPNRSCEMTMLENGIDRLDDLLNFAIWSERIQRKGAWYFLSEETAGALGCDVKLGQGANKVYEFLKDETNFQSLKSLIEEYLCQN
jgi:RecA/RadA recombinase